MTGSGSTIIGIVPSQKKAIDVVKKLHQRGINSRWTTTVVKIDNNLIINKVGGENHD